MAEELRSVLNEIVRLMQENHVDAAERKCRDALARWENDVNLVAMLGAVLASKGDTEEAEKHLRLAIEIEPAFAKPYEDLGALHLTRGDYDGAIQLFRKALALNPNQASATHRLCTALRILAKAATDDERFAAAEDYLKRIAGLTPDRAGALFDLGKFLRDRGRYHEAIAELQAAAHLAPGNPDIQSCLGNLLGLVGRTEEALQAYEHCLARSADDPAALIGRGHMLRVSGRTDEARKSYARCTNAHPHIGAAWWYLASLHGYAASDEDCERIQQQLDAGPVDREAEAGFRFALARAFENSGQYAAAWQQYTLGNGAKRSLVSYDAAGFKRDNQRIKETFSHSFFKGRAARTPTERTPIFILGMPRSGSTLVEQILASHSKVEGCGELGTIITLTSTLARKRPGSLHYTEIMGQLDAGELTGLGRSYLHSAAKHCSETCPCFTDKMPANFPHAGFIHCILPHAKIIDARRGALATCVANYRQLYAQGKYQSYDLGELGEYYLQYVEMMVHWDDVMPGKVLRVRYEDVVTDLEAQVRRLLEFCNLPFESSCVEFHKSRRNVNTASAEQVRAPLYAEGVDFWKHYDPYLDELRKVLAPVL